MQGAVREISVSLMMQKNSIAGHISFNPLSPSSDQHQISPHHISAL